MLLDFPFSKIFEKCNEISGFKITQADAYEAKRWYDRESKNGHYYIKSKIRVCSFFYELITDDNEYPNLQDLYVTARGNDGKIIKYFHKSLTESSERFNL